jgi:hypothetical protein
VSDAKPYVSGKRLVISRSYSCGGNIVLATFSCHWAAVAAYVRLKHPEFRSVTGDRADDLELEKGLPAAIAKATGRSHAR